MKRSFLTFNITEVYFFFNIVITTIPSIANTPKIIASMAALNRRKAEPSSAASPRFRLSVMFLSPLSVDASEGCSWLPTLIVC